LENTTQTPIASSGNSSWRASGRSTGTQPSESGIAWGDEQTMKELIKTFKNFKSHNLNNLISHQLYNKTALTTATHLNKFTCSQLSGLKEFERGLWKFFAQKMNSK
jgi:hypothetical protein